MYSYNNIIVIKNYNYKLYIIIIHKLSPAKNKEWKTEGKRDGERRIFGMIKREEEVISK